MPAAKPSIVRTRSCPPGGAAASRSSSPSAGADFSRTQLRAGLVLGPDDVGRGMEDPLSREGRLEEKRARRTSVPSGDRICRGKRHGSEHVRLILRCQRRWAIDPVDERVVASVPLPQQGIALVSGHPVEVPQLAPGARRRHDLTSHRLPPAAHGAVELLGQRATGLDLGRRLVQLEGGESLRYDGLVIATGCRARRLSAAGGGELTLRTLDDALILRQRIATRPSVVVVGGGPLGMEIASSCVAAGCEVTLVSHGPPLVRQLGHHLSGVLVAAARAHSVRIITTDDATVHERDGRATVQLSDGLLLEPELVVTAVGDVPNVDWLRTSGLVTNGALEVDAHGRLRPEIVAAGDVAAFPTHSGIRRIPLWNSAIERSRAAADGLLHGDGAATPDTLPYFWTEQFGLSVKVMGHLPVTGTPDLVDGDAGQRSALLRWEHPDGTGTVAAVNYRIAIPLLRRMCARAS